MRTSNKQTLRKPASKHNNKTKILIIVNIALLLAILVTAYLGRHTIVRVIGEHRLNKAEEVIPWGDDNTAKKENNDEPKQDITRNQESRNILFIGKDDIALNTDVMMLINLNTKENKISVMQIPRDSFFTYNGTPVKFNSMFARILNSSKKTGDEVQDKKNALDQFRQVLADNLSINIDYYAMIDLNGLVGIVDAIGGVPMYVPYDMKYTDPGQNLYIDIKEGQQTLTGAVARQYVRFRSGYVEADVGRQDAQKVFLVAFLNQFRSKFTLSNLGSIVKELDQYLITSLDDDQMTALAMIGYGMDLENISIFSAPGTPLSPREYYNGSAYYILNREALYKIVNEHFNLINTDIPEDAFDKNKNFTLLNNYTINAYYNKHLESVTVYSAQEIDQNGIDIKLK